MRGRFTVRVRVRVITYVYTTWQHAQRLVGFGFRVHAGSGSGLIAYFFSNNNSVNIKLIFMRYITYYLAIIRYKFIDTKL